MKTVENNDLRVVCVLDFFSSPQYYPVRDTAEAFNLAKALMNTIKIAYQKAKFVHQPPIINLEQYHKDDDEWLFWTDENGNDITVYTGIYG